PIIGLAIILLFQRNAIHHYPVLNSFVLIFVLFELAYPILGLLVGYDGLGAIGNTLRMALIWLPFYLYILLSEPIRVDRLDGFLNTVLRYSIVLNIIYGVVQIGVRVRLLPYSFLITKHLEPFAVDSHFRVVDGIRASGFFVNTTGLSVFAILAMSYFLASYIGKKKTWDGIFVLLSFLTVVLTTSRAGVITALLILAMGWIFIPNRGKLISVIIFLLIGILGYFIIDHYVGLDVLFGRFTRLIEGGASTDRSFSHRTERIWPKVFQALESFEFGTLVNAVNKVGLVDSGYLTYYAQGKWPFVLALVIFLLGTLIKSLNIFWDRTNWGNFLVLAIVMYLGFTMVVLNPMRSPFVIFFLLFGLWMAESHHLKNAKN
ncbi:MAG: hypothetical protein EA341_15665, partial [Mongoliibacter sp.]|uniref:hypothetical protein n=1 Tax=Mongoliibacter sp. TaxID=2022438 RepID=UPI0012F38E8D